MFYFRVGYINADNYADLVCHDVNGDTWTAVNDPESVFDQPVVSTNWFCSGDVNRFLIGDFIATDKQPFMCTRSEEWEILSNVV